ncbi:hypothetical protein ABZT04_26685 [Streptomyces sp. NPDC005492]|uniref:hypothetical protein n=1 Tax=Streptomyces sp. NPDC005492 TaxID=3156883 RepID=UPI0033AE99AC
MTRVIIAVALMYLVGTAGIVLSATGHGGHIPIIPFVLGIVANCCAVILTVLLMLAARRSRQ